jgi:steroid delta-isomerase-like uncharacterized protein
MSVEDNKTVVRRWVEAWNTHNVEATEELLAPGYVRHDANLPDVAGRDAERQFIGAALAAFPDIHFETKHLVAENDLVVSRLTVQGTHRAEFMGVPRSDRQVNFQSVEVFRISDGKIAEQWVVMDALGLLQQLGALPNAR